MVPGGTNVIPDYDPATIRAMNLSRAENLMSQKHSIQQQQGQRVLDAQAQANQMMAMEPYQRLQTYGQGIGQLAPHMGQYTMQQTPDPTPLQTALGVGTTLAGIYGLTNPTRNLFG